MDSRDIPVHVLNLCFAEPLLFFVKAEVIGIRSFVIALLSRLCLKHINSKVLTWFNLFFCSFFTNLVQSNMDYIFHKENFMFCSQDENWFHFHLERNHCNRNIHYMCFSENKKLNFFYEIIIMNYNFLVV